MSHITRLGLSHLAVVVFHISTNGMANNQYLNWAIYQVYGGQVERLSAGFRGLWDRLL